MNRDEILTVMQDTAGNPSSGPFVEWLPILADAVADALNPKAKSKD